MATPAEEAVAASCSRARCYYLPQAGEGEPIFLGP
jgi:hypothetical protein